MRCRSVSLSCKGKINHLIRLPKKIRADIIALGGIRGEYFPVFIELKAHRALKRLIQQLSDAKDAMNEAGDDFALMLSSATGKATQNIHIDRAQMLIVWTESQTGQECGAVSEARSAGFVLSTFGSPSLRIVRSHGKQCNDGYDHQSSP